MCVFCCCFRCGFFLLILCVGVVTLSSICMLKSIDIFTNTNIIILLLSISNISSQSQRNCASIRFCKDNFNLSSNSMEEKRSICFGNRFRLNGMMNFGFWKKSQKKNYMDKFTAIISWNEVSKWHFYCDITQTCWFEKKRNEESVKLVVNYTTRENQLTDILRDFELNCAII